MASKVLGTDSVLAVLSLRGEAQKNGERLVIGKPQPKALTR